MAKVKFTSNLKRFYPDLTTMDLDAKTIAEVVEQIDDQFKGIKDYVVDESGALRKHVNIFIGNELIKDRKSLQDKLEKEDEVYIMQALSGG